MGTPLALGTAPPRAAAAAAGMTGTAPPIGALAGMGMLMGMPPPMAMLPLMGMLTMLPLPMGMLTMPLGKLLGMGMLTMPLGTLLGMGKLLPIGREPYEGRGPEPMMPPLPTGTIPGPTAQVHKRRSLSRCRAGGGRRQQRQSHTVS